MVYGRVIGNELRDVPPEFLPIWGQRWSGYRAPHGPSSFSIRVFSVDRMSEVGPVLTSPTQFEMTLAEEDEGEDSSPESGQFRSRFPPSSIPIQTRTTESTFWRETPMPRSIHYSSNRPDDSPKMLHQSAEHLHPQISTPPFCVTLPPRRQPIPLQGGDGSLENDYTLWDMDHTSTGTELQTNHFIPIPSGQLQHTAPLHTIHTQLSEYPSLLDPLPQPGGGCLFLLCQGDDRVPTTLPSTSCFTAPQVVADDPPWNYESRITLIPDASEPRYSIVPPWPQGLALPSLPLPGFLQNSESPLCPGMFYQLVSDHDGKPTYPENVSDTFMHAEDCTRLSLDKPGYLDPGGR